MYTLVLAAAAVNTLLLAAAAVNMLVLVAAAVSALVVARRQRAAGVGSLVAGTCWTGALALLLG